MLQLVRFDAAAVKGKWLTTPTTADPAASAAPDPAPADAVPTAPAAPLADADDEFKVAPDCDAAC